MRKGCVCVCLGRGGGRGGGEREKVEGRGGFRSSLLVITVLSASPRLPCLLTLLPYILFTLPFRFDNQAYTGNGRFKYEAGFGGEDTEVSYI